MSTHDKPARKDGLARIWSAFKCSLNGLRLTFAKEAAFRQELCGYVVLLVVLFFLPLSSLLKVLLLTVNTIVLAVELLNSSIEAMVDIVSPEYHDLARRAKDMASAAVFVSILLALTLWVWALYMVYCLCDAP